MDMKQVHFHNNNNKVATNKQNKQIEFVLDRVTKDHLIVTSAQDNSRRRTVVVQQRRAAGTYGFTLQTYGIHRSGRKEVEMLTYVDYVDIGGAAHVAGVRPGDVILSINGQNMENSDHVEIVNYIQKCKRSLRMVLMFEDCVRKVDLHLRCIKLKNVLTEKMAEFRTLCSQEKLILENLKEKPTAGDCRRESDGRQKMSPFLWHFDVGEFQEKQASPNKMDEMTRL